ncbi:MAG: trehalose-phosphatase [Desulfomonile tiedjei]|uniref:Trehalose 6-phosphate phosphatase n=1 Tax=Desulfomonile tiedjei TaxID=2358 RepID=A0A9D6V3M6_9BACT|nr:trehalose-phosphatase [Desulfomonile tiedjei]
MNSVGPFFDLDAFFKRLKHADKRALLLDYDGTLAPFRLNREEAVPYQGIRVILNKFLELDHTRLVIISGRPINGLRPILGLQRSPEIWGSHGLERFVPDGTYKKVDLRQEQRKGLERARQWLEHEELTQYCEYKPAGIAIHTRGLDKVLAERMVEKVRRGMSFVSGAGELTLQDFDGGVELRIRGIDKGLAVTAILDELGTNAVAAYLGDDLTDEDAFRAIKGHGVGVLVRSEFRPTAASLWLKPPHELLAFLQGWLEALGGKEWQGKVKGDSS